MRRLLNWLRHEHHHIIRGLHLEMERDLPFAHTIEGPLETASEWRNRSAVRARW